MSLSAALKGMTGVEQAKVMTAKIEGLSIAEQRLQDAKRTIDEYEAKLRQKDQELAKTKKDLYHVQDDLEDVEKENKYYESLLCQPMQQIAQQNGNFKQTYEAQQQILADWMASQKAFKELAIEFGFEDGLSAEEVIKKGNNKKLDVLDNKHDPKHGTNANDVNILEDRIEATRVRVQNQLNK